MKIYTKVVMDWDGNILEEESHEYDGPIAECKGGGSTTTVQKDDPWEGIQPYLTELYSGAASNYRKGPEQMFPMQTYAGLTPHQTGGMYGGLDYMQGTFAPQTERYIGGLQGMIDAPADVTTDPAVQAMIAANKGEVTDVLQGEWLPGIRRGSIAAGDYGGSKTDILGGQAVGDAAEALARANAQTYGQAYSDAMKQASYASSAMPGAMQMGMTPYQYQQQIGGIEQGMDQAAIDEAMQRHYFPGRAEQERLRNLNEILQGGLRFGESTATESAGGGSPLLGAAGGGLLGYGLASSIPSLAGTTALGLGPLGLGIAGGAALLGGLYS